MVKAEKISGPNLYTISMSEKGVSNQYVIFHEGLIQPQQWCQGVIACTQHRRVHFNLEDQIDT